MKTKMTPAQCRAARALLGWDQVKLATAAGGWSINVVSTFERGMFDKVAAKTIDEIQATLEANGVTFIADLGVLLYRKGWK
jgi:hypothetical protein